MLKWAEIFVAQMAGDEMSLPRLKLNDQQLRISIGLRLGGNICVAHTRLCGKRVERDGLQVFLAPRVLVASHAMLLSILS